MERHRPDYCSYCWQCGRWVATDAGHLGFRLCIFCSGRISDLDVNQNHDYPDTDPFPAYYEDQVSDIAQAMTSDFHQHPPAPQWTRNESRPWFYPDNHRDYNNNEDDYNNYDYDTGYWAADEWTRGQRSVGFPGQWSDLARDHFGDTYQDWDQDHDNDLRNIVVQARRDNNSRNVTVDSQSAAGYRSGHARSEVTRSAPRQTTRGRGTFGGRRGHQRQEAVATQRREEARSRWSEARLREMSARRDGAWAGGRAESARYSDHWTPARRGFHFRHQRPRPWAHRRRQNGRYRWPRSHGNVAAEWSGDRPEADDNQQQTDQNNPGADIQSQTQQPPQNPETQPTQASTPATSQPPSQLAILREERQRMQHLHRTSDRFYRALETVRKVPVTEGGAPCTICFDTFSPPETVACLPCGHNFHVLCIETWLCRQQTCPLCRHSLLVDDRRRSRQQGY